MEADGSKGYEKDGQARDGEGPDGKGDPVGEVIQPAGGGEPGQGGSDAEGDEDQQ